MPGPPAPEPLSPRSTRRRGTTFAVAGVLLAVLAVGGVSLLRTTPGDEVAARADPAGENGDGLGTHQMARQLAEVRGLSVREEIEAVRLPGDDYDPVIREYATREENQLRTQERVLGALHLLPDDVDLVALTADLWAEQFAGHYDERSGTAYVRAESDALSALERSILADEIVEALLDRTYDVAGMLEEAETADAQRALVSVVKGDTFTTSGIWQERFFTEEEHEQRRADQSLRPVQIGESLPQALRAELTFPFVAGPEFVRAVFDAGGLEALAEAYENPPTTTAQVLHPELYAAGTEPVEIAVDGSPGSGWEDLTTRSFGEFDLIQLAGANDSGLGEPAGDGWAGGHLRAWERDDEVAVGIAVVFTDEREAEEGCAAITAWYTGAAPDAAGGEGAYESARDAMRIACEGAEVRVGVAPDPDTAAAVIQS
jgi:hypothetical protein